MDPMTATALAKSAGQVAQGLGAALGGPMTAGAPTSSHIDGSGWVVSTGGSRASSRGSGVMPSLYPDASVDPMLIMAALALLALVVIKRMR